MKYCINGGNVIRLIFLSAKLLKFEIQKCGQILCAHKPYFLMPDHKLTVVCINRCTHVCILLTIQKCHATKEVLKASTSLITC